MNCSGSITSVGEQLNFLLSFSCNYVVSVRRLLGIGCVFYCGTPWAFHIIILTSFLSLNSVVRVRETRLTGIISHVMIGLSMLLLPYPLSYIPAPVLDGLFLYVAFTALYGNQMFDRIMLIFTEQVM